MLGLTTVHWIYLLFSILIFVALVRKREIVLVGIAGILAVVLVYTGSPVTAFQALMFVHRGQDSVKFCIFLSGSL